MSVGSCGLIGRHRRNFRKFPQLPPPCGRFEPAAPQGRNWKPQGYIFVKKLTQSGTPWLHKNRTHAQGEQEGGAGVARACRGRGAGYRLRFGMSGAGVARTFAVPPMPMRTWTTKGIPTPTPILSAGESSQSDSDFDPTHLKHSQSGPGRSPTLGCSPTFRPG
eukprot:gene7525-biopygen19567